MTILFQSSKKGFTLIELLIGLSILSILTAIIFTTFVSFKKNQALEKDTEAIVEILQQARSQTLSSQNSSQYGIHFAAPKITLFAGSVYSAGDASNQDFVLSSTDTILSINIVGGGSETIFNRLTGETNQNGTIIVSSGDISKTKTITIYKTGLVETQ
jgi:prepilin-type N-terminal cleavage/methylation domain-containing protein